MVGNDKDTAIVRSVIAMAHALGLSVVAEGVEDLGAQDLLTALRCDTAQGYLYSPPVDAQTMADWLNERAQREEIQIQAS
jgi:EAL domain-containing protein (putative c-di-GMP-specific phosphodiesterase class I)